jgi:hypothetical protein
MGGTDGIRERGIAYQPLPSQRAFHDLKTRFKGFSGPIGSGKSQALCQEAIRLTYLNVGRTGLLGAPTYPMLRDTTLASLFSILDANGIPYDHNKGENSLLLKETRSRILFRPVDEFERLRGMNLAWFGLDELTYSQEEAWLRLQGRLRDPKAKVLCGFAVWTPKGFDWVYRRFIESPQRDCGVVRAQPYENRYMLEKVSDYYDRLKDSYDEKFFAQEVMGEYLPQDGMRVYRSFDPQENVRKLEVDPSRPLLWAMDFNVDPMSSVVAQIVDDQVRVVDEVVLRQSTTVQACEEFLRRYPRHPAGLHIYGDASGYQHQTTGYSDYEMIMDYLTDNSNYTPIYRTPKANPEVQQRVNLMNAKMLSARGDRTMWVDPQCKELIKDFEEVCFRSEDGKIDKEKDRMRTHTSDALGYLVWQEFCAVKWAGGQQKRLVS